VNEEALRLIQRYDGVANDLEDNVVRSLDASLLAAYDDLEAEFVRLYSRMQDEQLSLTARAQAAALMSELGPLLDIIDPSQEEAYTQRFEAMLQEAEALGAEMAGELAAAIAPNSDLRQYTAIPIEAVALQARDGVRRLYRWNEEFRGRASGIIEQSLIQGWGPRRATEQLRGQLGITRFRAETIARTETMSALNDAAQRRYQQGGVEGVQWVVSVGEVCPFCVARNGRVYETGKIRIPAHPRCRCIPVPWKASWDTDDEFMAQYVSDRLRDLERDGGSPNYGPSPFERAAGLTTAPEPIWKPGQARLNPPQQSGRSQNRGSVTSPSAMPEGHVITLNQRFKPNSLDSALDSIDTPGASGRVGLFRQFVQQQDLQVFLWDSSQSRARQVTLALQQLRYQKGFNNKKVMPIAIAPKSGSNGFTANVFRHVVVSTNSAGQGSDFTPDPARLRQVVQTLVRDSESKLRWSASSAARGQSDSVSAVDSQNFVTYLHEMGHQVHFTAGTPPRPGAAKNLSEYSQTNDREWFAEHFTAWMLDADEYRRYDPVGAEFIENAVNQAVSAPRRLE